LFFQAAVGIATQGFGVVDVGISNEMSHLLVQDATDQDPLRRGIHASQFLVMTWVHFPKPLVRVTFLDRRGRRCLEATVAGSDCEEVAEERIPFEALADRVTFRVLGDGPTASET